MRLCPLTKEQTNALSIMCSPDALCDGRADVDCNELLNCLLVLVLRDSIRHYQLLDWQLVDEAEVRGGEQAMRDQRMHGLGAFFVQSAGGHGEGLAGINHVVDEDRDLEPTG